VTVTLAGARPVKVTEQLPETRLQLAPTVPAAGFDAVKPRVPVGVLEVEFRSVTVAVHVDVWPTRMMLGTQTTLVDVVSFATAVTVMAAEVPVLPL
jgi:hypothetical protein